MTLCAVYPYILLLLASLTTPQSLASFMYVARSPARYTTSLRLSLRNDGKYVNSVIRNEARLTASNVRSSVQLSEADGDVIVPRSFSPFSDTLCSYERGDVVTLVQERTLQPIGEQASDPI